MVRLFAVQLNERQQPQLLNGEIERSSLAKVDIVFEDVGGVEGYLSDEYTGGYALLTNIRIIWISSEPDGTPFNGFPCHLPLGAIADADLKTSFLSLKPAKITIGVRVNAQGYPVSDAVSVSRLVKIKLVSKAGKPDAWHSALQNALQRRAWNGLPPDTVQSLHSSPVRLPNPARIPGPMTPPRLQPDSVLLANTTPNPLLSNNNMAETSTTPQQQQQSVMPDTGIIAELRSMGFNSDQAASAAIATRNSGVQQAVDWILEHPPNTLSAQQQYSPLTSSLQQPVQQQQQPAVVSSSLMNVGVGGILHRQEQRAAETDQTMTVALQDLEQLMAKAGEMAELAKYFRKRVGSSTTPNAADGSTHSSESGAEELDNATAEELINLGLAGAVTKESAGELYHQELARQVAQVLSGPVNRAGGMMPLPDAYCLFNRARFTDLVSPDDLLKAMKLLPKVHAPLKLIEFSSGVKVIQSIELNEDAVCKRVSELASPPSTTTTVEVDNLEAIGSPWVSAIGPGITRVDVANALNVPLPVAGEHLSMAESKGLLCRDEGPDGLRFYKNFFIHAQ